MTAVNFYHLLRQPVEAALPRLMERVLEVNARAVIRVADDRALEALDGALWSYDPDSFLPHGTRHTGHADQQPVYLTTDVDNPNGASILVLVNDVTDDGLNDYERCLIMFDGRDETLVQAARTRWKRLKETGHAMSYYQQNTKGAWEKKA